MEKIKMFDVFVTESFDEESVNEFFGEGLLTIAAVIFAIKLLSAYVKNKKLETTILKKISNESDPEKKKELKSDLREIKETNKVLRINIKKKSDQAESKMDKVDATEKAEAKIELEKIKKELQDITIEYEKINPTD